MRLKTCPAAESSPTDMSLEQHMKNIVIFQKHEIYWSYSLLSVISLTLQLVISSALQLVICCHYFYILLSVISLAYSLLSVISLAL